MARSDKRYSVYPDPVATEEVGSSTPDLNAAIEQYAILRRIVQCGDKELEDRIWRIADSILRAAGK